MNETEINALLRLLEDNNLALAQEAEDVLVSLREVALPALRAYADINPALASRVTQRIEAQLLEEEWLALTHAPDAEAAALLIARWLEPLVEAGTIEAQLEALAAPLRGRIPGPATASSYKSDAIVLREWLAGTKGFRGNSSDYYAPENSLLPYVLETKRGLPITLSMVYLFVARRLAAPLYPIGLPGHFIVRYGEGDGAVYLDPFHDGALMTRADCRRVVSQHGVAWQEAYLQPVSDHALIERVLRNLVNAYAAKGDEITVAQTVKYYEIWTDFHSGQ